MTSCKIIKLRSTKIIFVLTLLLILGQFTPNYSEPTGDNLNLDTCPTLKLFVVPRTEQSCNRRYSAAVSQEYLREMKRLKFKWTLRNARIIKTVKDWWLEIETTAKKNQRATVKIEIEGLEHWPSACPKSDTVSIQACKP